uniref:Putative tick kunitz 95 n=1 Tax=Amblyomma triste TaxID=251400 RepID=A0A023G8C7_AMBTT
MCTVRMKIRLLFAALFSLNKCTETAAQAIETTTDDSWLDFTIYPPEPEEWQKICNGNETSPACKGICSLPVDPGPCRAFIYLWHFNGSSCVRFVYGGCQGNGNSFEQLSDCTRICGKAT